MTTVTDNQDKEALQVLEKGLVHNFIFQLIYTLTYSVLKDNFSILTSQRAYGMMKDCRFCIIKELPFLLRSIKVSHYTENP